MLDFQLLHNLYHEFLKENQTNVKLPHDGDNNVLLYTRCPSLCKKHRLPTELETLYTLSATRPTI